MQHGINHQIYYQQTKPRWCRRSKTPGAATDLCTALSRNDDEDLTRLWELTGSDPVAVTMGSFRLLAPTNKASVQGLLDMTKDAVLRFFVCLSPALPGQGESQKERAPASGECRRVTGTKPQRPYPIGYVILWPQTPFSAQHHAVVLGISLATEYRGRGYGSEAINWAMDWGFARAGLHRIGLRVFEYNSRALKLYKRLGFIEEGRDREALLFERKRWDVINMGILEREWEELRVGVSDRFS